MLHIEGEAGVLQTVEDREETQQSSSAKQMQPVYYQDEKVNDKLLLPSGDEK